MRKAIPFILFLTCLLLAGVAQLAAQPLNAANRVRGLSPPPAADEEPIRIFPTLSSPSVKNGGTLEIGALVKAKSGVRSVAAEILDGDRLLAALPLELKPGISTAATASALAPAAEAAFWSAKWLAAGLEEKKYAVRIKVTDLDGAESLDASLSFSDPIAGIVTPGTTNYPAQLPPPLTMPRNSSFPWLAFIDHIHGYAYFTTEAYSGAVVVRIRLSDFSWAGDLKFDPINPNLYGEDGVGAACAIIDPAGVYAYVGMMNYPGTIVRIQLSDFTLAGELMREDLRGSFSTGVIDPGGEFAYFANWDGETRIVKLRLSDFQIADSLNLGEDNGIVDSCSFMDPGGEFAYFAGGNPGRVVKIQLSDFTQAASLILNSGEEYPITAALDDAGNYAYIGVDVKPAKVVKINLSSFSRVGALTFNAAEYGAKYSQIDENYVNFITNDRNSLIDRVARIRLSDFTSAGSLFSNGVDKYFGPTVIDRNSGLLYLGADKTENYRSQAIIERIQTSDFTSSGSLMLPIKQRFLSCSAVDPAGEFGYFANDDLHASQETNYGSIITKVRLSDLAYVDQLKLNSDVYGLYWAAIDPSGSYAYFLSAYSPIIKVRLADFSVVDELEMEEDELSIAFLIDEAGAYGYVVVAGNLGSAPRIVKIRMSDFTPIDALDFDADIHPNSAALDSDGQYMYVGDGDAAGGVVKIRLADFAQVGYLSLSSDEDDGAAMFTDHAGYLYAASSKKLVRIRTSDFTRVDVRTLSMDSYSIASAVADAAREYAYVGMEQQIFPRTLPPKIVQVRLSDFSIADTFILDPQDVPVHPALDVNSGNIYYAAPHEPGRVFAFPTTGMPQTGYVKATQFEMPEWGTPTAAFLYSHSAAGRVRLAIYDDVSPSRRLMWQSNSLVNNVSEDYLYSFFDEGHPDAPLLLQPGKYWLAWQTNDPEHVPSYLAGEDGDGVSFEQPYGVFPISINDEFASTGEKWTSYISYDQAPPPILMSNDEIEENPAPDALVGELSISNAPSGSEFTYIFVGPESSAGGRFKVVGDQILVANPALIDYEGAASHTVRVRAVDQFDYRAFLSFEIQVLDQNEPPLNLTLSGSRHVNENAANGAFIGNLGTLDPDLSDTITYVFVAPEADAGGRFQIAGSQLQVANGAALDYETRTSHPIRVKASDQGGLSVTKAFTIYLDEVNEAPENITLGGDRSVGEDASDGTLVGDLGTVDPDDDGPFVYLFAAPQGDAGGRFALDGSQLIVGDGDLLNYSNAHSHAVRIQSTDEGGLSLSKVFTIAVENVNQAPTNISLSGPRIVTINPLTGTYVGTLGTIDPDNHPANAYVYSFAPPEGDAGGRFRIAGAELQSADGDLIDAFDVKHRVRVRSTDPDGFSTEKLFTITVDDGNLPPTNIGLSGSRHVDENAPNNTVVGILTTIDPDEDETFTYVITQPSAGIYSGRFKIIGDELRVKDGTLLDYEDVQSYLLTILSRDHRGRGITKDFTIWVNDLPE